MGWLILIAIIAILYAIFGTGEYDMDLIEARNPYYSNDTVRIDLGETYGLGIFYIREVNILHITFIVVNITIRMDKFNGR